MKIQCDVCEKQRASVFCAADEAALCDECDQRVHRANKLASKHQRFSLQHPSFKDAPLCDICQERKALLFCREDRAILCRECDIPIHKANEHTQNHNRFLLTGVRLNPTTASSTHCPNSSLLSSTSSNPNSNTKTSDSVSSYNNNNCDNHNVFSQHNLHHSSNYYMDANTTTNTTMMNYKQNSEEGSNSTSNIIHGHQNEIMHGWRLEDLLASYTSYDQYL